jgi:hypothetical protein
LGPSGRCWLAGGRANDSSRLGWPEPDSKVSRADAGRPVVRPAYSALALGRQDDEHDEHHDEHRQQQHHHHENQATRQPLNDRAAPRDTARRRARSIVLSAAARLELRPAPSLSGRRAGRRQAGAKLEWTRVSAAKARLGVSARARRRRRLDAAVAGAREAGRNMSSAIRRGASRLAGAAHGGRLARPT